MLKRWVPPPLLLGSRLYILAQNFRRSNDGLTCLVRRYVDDRPIAMILICHISFHTSCSYLGDVALCQSLVYDLLYRNVFGMAEEIEIGMKVSS